MLHYARKAHLAITLLLITSIGHVQAYDYLISYDNDCLISYGNFECWTPREPTNSECCCCNCGFISADLLFWRPFEGGLDNCVPSLDSTSVAGGVVTSTFAGTSRTPSFKWNPGFRVGAGYDIASSGWGLETYWTHFQSHAYGNNSFRWNVDFDVVDVTTGYKTGLSSCFDFRTFGGLRVARINQRLNLSEFGTELVAVNNKENFFGLGPVIGVTGDWDVGCGFSFYGNASASLLYGKFKIIFDSSSQSATSNSFSTVEKHLDTSQTAADFGFGIRWLYCFCQNQQVIFQLGLEHHRYFNFNRIGCYGDLSFDGLNFSALFIY